MVMSKLPSVNTSIFSVMSAMASKYEAINLAQGFPNFESDSKLNELVTKAMRDKHNQYAPMPGLLSLREKISEKIEKEHRVSYNPKTEITITAGATQAIFTAIAATINKGDEVIIFTPAYDCYEPTITLFGGKTIAYQLEAPYYKPNWGEVKNLLTQKTKMLIINTPHNPSGTLFIKEDMLALQEIVVAHNLLVISDEVYEHIIFDGHIHQSAARFSALKNRTFITASFGKTFHVTGWKLGYCVAPEVLMQEFRKVHQYNVFCVNHPMQVAISNYLEDSDKYMALPKFYENKRDTFLSLMKDSKFAIIPSQGTYFQLLGFAEITDESDIAFAERLTKNYGLATIPTSVFNNKQEDFKRLRVCFAKTDETLREAAAILQSI